MPPKQQYTREDILDAAFSLMQKEGPAGLSVRRIAERLGCSTAPVYSYCKDMEEVREAVMERALNLLLEYSERRYTDDAFLNVGVGLLVFARENPLLYRELFLNGSRFSHMLKRFSENRISVVQSEPFAALLGSEKMQTIFDKLAVFTNGLAAMVCADLLGDTSDEFFIRALLGVGADFMGSAIFQSGRADLLEVLMHDPQYQSIASDFKLELK